jgi:phospholipid transport system substrate-binding protein
MRHTRTTLALLTAAFLWLAAPLSFADTAAQTPQAMIRQTTEQVIDRLKAEQQTLQAHPQKIHSFIKQYLLPHFDFQRMSQWVLGRYWRTATPQQRSAFVTQFENLLIDTYGNALSSYSGQTITYQPTLRQPDGSALVRTELHDSNGGPAIPVDYRMYNDNGQWKVFDLSIDNVSLITNYRESFAPQIQRSSLDGLIQQMAKHNGTSAS